MIRFEGVSFRYVDSPQPVLRNVDLTIAEGDLVLVAGRTGSGKSTLLGAVNGLVPHFTGGRLDGRVLVDGLDTRSHPPREFAHLVGVVGQDPVAGFVTDTVEEELAYAMEQLALRPDLMRKRVEEILDLLGIADLRARPLATLSGGQQQRVAIGSVLTSHPRVLVLDEPTSALDPTAAEELLAAIARLVHDLGVTVLLAEHRMERVVQFADRVVFVDESGDVHEGPTATMMETIPIVPPVVELGRMTNWSPLPMSVRDARRQADRLRSELVVASPPVRVPAVDPDVLLSARGVTVRYGARVAVRSVDLDLRAGQVVALMGRNGAGKSTLMWSLQGSGERDAGVVTVDGQDPANVSSRQARALVGLVPQTASDLLYLDTVEGECAQADLESEAPAGSCRALLDRLAPGIPDDVHPRDLSEGQRLSLVLAVQLVAAPKVMLLDEPTRGLDYTAKRAFGEIVRDLADSGAAVVVSTHDVEFVASVADHVVVMAEGEIVATGPTADVISASPMFAPQVSKIVGIPGWLTVAQVEQALLPPVSAATR